MLVAEMFGVERVNGSTCVVGPKQLIFVGAFLETNLKNGGNIDVPVAQRGY